MEWFGRNPVGSIKTAVSPLCGNHDTWRARTGLRPLRFSPRLRQATDLTVAQAVVDEDEKFARRRHAADLIAPAFSHVAVVTSDGRIGALSGCSLDGGPAHEARTLLICGACQCPETGWLVWLGWGEVKCGAAKPALKQPRRGSERSEGGQGRLEG